MIAAPSLDLHRFKPIDPSAFVEARLAFRTKPPTEKQLALWLKKYLSSSEVSSALEELSSKERLRRQGNKLELEKKVRDAVRERLGPDVNEKDWDKAARRQFALPALGFDAHDRLARQRVGRAEGLQTLIIAVGYGLHENIELTTTDVRSELLWRFLRAHLPKVLEGQEAPPLSTGALERTLIAGLAGKTVRSMNQAWGALAAKIIDSPESDVAGLSTTLIIRGLRQARPSGGLEQPRTSGGLDQPQTSGGLEQARTPNDLEPGASNGDGAPPEPNDFAARVLDVTRSIVRQGSRFGSNVPIADVYDAYGRDHADAGSLADFKSRLVAAAERRELSLSRIDLPELMSQDLRERSATRYGFDDRHLVVGAEGEDH